MRRGMNAGKYVRVSLRGVTQRQRAACSGSCATAAALTRRSGATSKCAASRPARRVSQQVAAGVARAATIERCIQLPKRRGAPLMQRERL